MVEIPHTSCDMIKSPLPPQLPQKAKTLSTSILDWNDPTTSLLHQWIEKKSTLQHSTPITAGVHHKTFGRWTKLGAIKEKLLFPSLFSHSTLNTCGHQMCGVSPHTKQFSDTSWVSYTLTQFWHCLHGFSFRSQELRAQSHKTAFISLGTNWHHLCSWLASYKSEVSTAGVAYRTQENSLLTRLPVYY